MFQFPGTLEKMPGNANLYGRDMIIHHLSHQQIDLERWDAAIERAPNGLPYAYSWYLDAVTAGNWDALATPDYAAIMPLPWNRRLLGLRQCYQPIFSQQLGVFGPSVDEETVKRFLLAIPPAFRLVRLHLNEANRCELPGITLSERTNLVLDLDRPYAQIRKNYSKGLRSCLKRATDRHRTRELTDPGLLLAFFRLQLGDRLRLHDVHYARLHRLLRETLARGKGRFVGVQDAEGRLLAATFFLHSHGRIINLLSASSAAGRDRYAMHYLLDRQIQQHAGQPLLFDFEGSEIEGVARFFKSFGSERRPYFRYERDELPAPVRWLLALARKIRR